MNIEDIMISYIRAALFLSVTAWTLFIGLWLNIVLNSDLFFYRQLGVGDKSVPKYKKSKYLWG